MYILNFRKYKTVIIGVILFVCIFSIITIKSYAMTHYQETDFVTGLVTASALNVRQGPGITFKIVAQVYKNQYIRVFARIGDWYVIQTDNDILGAVSVKYIKPIYPSSRRFWQSRWKYDYCNKIRCRTGIRVDKCKKNSKWFKCFSYGC